MILIESFDASKLLNLTTDDAQERKKNVNRLKISNWIFMTIKMRKRKYIGLNRRRDGNLAYCCEIVTKI